MSIDSSAEFNSHSGRKSFSSATSRDTYKYNLSVISESHDSPFKSRRSLANAEDVAGDRRSSVAPFAKAKHLRPIGKLFVQVHSAADLPLECLSCCSIHILGRQGKRKLFKTGSNENGETSTPKWQRDNRISYPLDIVNEYYVRVAICDAQHMGRGNDKIGVLFIPLNTIREETCGWFDLHLKNPGPPQLYPRVLVTISIEHMNWTTIDNLHSSFFKSIESRKFQFEANLGNSQLKVPGSLEKIEMFLENFMVSQSRLVSKGTLVITNLRIVFLAFENIDQLQENSLITLDRFLSFVVPFRSISSVTSEQGKMNRNDNGTTLSLIIDTKDFRRFRLVFADKFRENRKQLLPIIAKTIERKRERKSSDLASHIFAHIAPVKKKLYQKFEITEEFKLQGIEMTPFSESQLNKDYNLCATYPPILYFPSSIIGEILKGSALFRSRGRLPTLTYYSKRFKTCISRSSQPAAGLTNQTSLPDELLIDAFRRASPIPDAKFVIFDARSVLAAETNRFKGKGVEAMERYKNTKILFGDIANIHHMRWSLEKLMELCLTELNNESSWFSLLEGTKWMFHLRNLLHGAVQIAESIARKQTSVLVHCSDGWDRTAQLCALAQVMLDERYRTIDGFCSLVRKEFLWFGHKFEDRLGDEKPNEQSPIFLQFLDAIHQIMRQFPSSFEFNDEFLVQLAQMVHCEWFGTFLCNSDAERIQSRLNEKTLDLWKFLYHERYRNIFYSKDNLGPIFPIASTKRLELWTNFYLRFDDTSFQSLEYRTVSADPMWVSEESFASCRDCGGRFSLLRRKKACTACGNSFCRQCLTQKICVGKSKKPQNVCAACYKEIVTCMQ